MHSKELEPLAQKALTFLHEKALEHGTAKAQSEYMDSWVKVEKARIMDLFVGMSNAAAEAEALRHPAFEAALEAKKEADVAHHTNVFKRERRLMPSYPVSRRSQRMSDGCRDQSNANLKGKNET